jgi:acetyl-CoA synthetase
MMGPWLVSGSLTLGATAFLYDGSPDFPDPGRVWGLVERHQVTVLGIAPTVVRALMRSGDEWVARHDLSSLRILGASGEPWNPGPWRWYQDVVGGGRCPLINYSGGTEISGGIVASTPMTPAKPTSFAGPVPGMDADVVDEQGNPVRGIVGELAIRQPWPGMTRGFWRDPERYLETYWSRVPDLWVHGDWALVDRDGFWFIQGRSDDTIKVAGKRLGPAEVESAAVTHPGVAEAAAIGVPHELKGETVVVFCVPRPGQEPADQLREEVSAAIVRSLGKSLAPDRVLFVREMPRTRSGKVMRRVIRAVYLGQEPGDLSSLENPSGLDEVRAAR